MSLYLDYNATAPLCEQAKKVMIEGMDWSGNASSVHHFGRQVRQKIEEARQNIGDFFQVKAGDVIFTSGATEANHLSLCGFEGRVIVSAIEHDSIDQARPDREVCPVGPKGTIDLNALEVLLQSQEGPVLVSIMAANNETGTIQPIEEVVALARKYNAFVHCDAVQAIGRIPLLWNGIDLLSVSAHKLGGPQGVGALIMRTDMPLKAQLRGGGQERSFRSGTENFLGILGFAAAVMATKEQNWNFVKTLRDRLESHLKDRCSDVIFLGHEAPRLPNTTVIAMKGVKSATQVMNFDLAGIAISAGSACSSGKVKRSRVLAAMGIAEELAACSVRVSLGPTSSEELIDRFVDVWLNIYERAQAK